MHQALDELRRHPDWPAAMAVEGAYIGVSPTDACRLAWHVRIEHVGMPVGRYVGHIDELSPVEFAIKAAALRGSFSAPRLIRVRVRISATVADDYARFPRIKPMPLHKLRKGWRELTVDEARAVLADAEESNDHRVHMPCTVTRAGNAFARQLRAALSAARCSAT